MSQTTLTITTFGCGLVVHPSSTIFPVTQDDSLVDRQVLTLLAFLVQKCEYCRAGPLMLCLACMQALPATMSTAESVDEAQEEAAVTIALSNDYAVMFEQVMRVSSTSREQELQAF